MRQPRNFIEEIEIAADEVSTWAAELIKEIIETLAPDGRLAFTEEKPLSQQIEEYSQVRGNPLAWQQWMAAKGNELMTKLGSQLSPDALATINPQELVTAFAMDYSIRMEKAIRDG